MRKRISIVKARQHIKVPRGGRVRRSNKGWDIVDANGNTVQHFEPAPGKPADDNPNWMSFSDLSPAPLPPMQRFIAVWNVPPLPTDGTLTIYFFNGLEESSGQNILQPVLQWGPTAHGSIPGTWSIASWYVGATGSPAFSSEAVAVAPGTQLTGVMELNGSVWTCYFVGFPGTTLVVDTLPDMQVASLTLEAYTDTNGVPTDLTLAAPTVSFQITALATVSGAPLTGSQWAPFGQWPAVVNSPAAQTGKVTTAYS